MTGVSTNKAKVRSKAVVAITLAVCVAAVAAGLVLQGRAQAADYAEAQRLADVGDAQGAYELFQALGDYGDSRARADALVQADPALPFRSAAKGDVVTFGSWEQDGDEANGPEPLTWIVLDKVDGRLLLLSEDCLDARPYNPAEFQAVTWEGCALRAWLNDAFLNGAFTSAERALVPAVQNVNESRIGSQDEDAAMYDVIEASESGAAELGEGGSDTVDRAFLLSETDTLIYLHDEISRATTGKARLAAAADVGRVRVGDDGCVGWWLRSPGVYGFTAQFVTEEGAPYTAGAYVELYYGVRPAIWLDMSGGIGGGEGGAGQR